MPLDEERRAIILTHTIRMVSTREFPKTICPSEVARAFSPAELQTLDASSWRDTMDPIREVVWELRGEGQIEILQKGQVLSNEVELGDVRGPIRVRAIQK
jgi:hypothetical protein